MSLHHLQIINAAALGGLRTDTMIAGIETALAVTAMQGLTRIGNGERA